MTATKEQFFKPAKRSLRGKGGVSEHKAMQIAAEDAAARVRKTERLRKLREASLADAQVATPDTLASKTG